MGRTIQARVTSRSNNKSVCMIFLYILSHNFSRDLKDMHIVYESVVAIYLRWRYVRPYSCTRSSSNGGISARISQYIFGLSIQTLAVPDVLNTTYGLNIYSPPPLQCHSQLLPHRTTAWHEIYLLFFIGHVSLK